MKKLKIVLLYFVLPLAVFFGYLLYSVGAANFWTAAFLVLLIAGVVVFGRRSTRQELLDMQKDAHDQTQRWRDEMDTVDVIRRQQH